MNKEMAGNLNPQKEVFNQKLNPLFDFIDQEIYPNAKNPSILVGEWHPTYISADFKCHRQTLTELHGVFNELSQHFHYWSHRPKFLECGSGHGEIGFLASIAGFDSYNVETQEELHLKAEKYTKELENLKIIQQNTVHCLNGSFYTPEMFYQYRKEFKRYHQNLTSERESISSMMFDLGLLKKDQNSSTMEIIESELIARQEKTEIWNDRPDLYNKGYFDFNVVYSFPSDPFFDVGFMDQMVFSLRPGSFLVLNRFSSQVGKLIQKNLGYFDKFGFDIFPLQNFSNEKFLVLRKNGY